MKLGDQAAGRANTGVQWLFKKYRNKNVYIKIKWLDATQQSTAGMDRKTNGGCHRSERLVH
ncbi:hypothetical protein [Aeromonas salmonicida]|uniref:hypothetical protein n=1 Tax=Aeromonas salmonicida TaxID=645 RepID=UPI001F33E7B4|nr:hypothetical protein [Aeromonas salmonicida]MCE9936567.1 hypothetical protein [Aeromonas salmonicida]